MCTKHTHTHPDKWKPPPMPATREVDVCANHQNSPDMHLGVGVVFLAQLKAGGRSSQQQEAATPFNQYAGTVVGGQ